MTGSKEWIARNRVRAVLFGIVLIAGLVVLVRFWRPGTPSEAAGRRSGGPQTVAVDTKPVSRMDVPVEVQGLGTAQAYNTVTITTRIDGELQKLGFTEGQLVHKGDLLAQIDPRPYQAALEQAEATHAKDQAQLESAKQDLSRYVMLAPQNLTSQQTLDAQRATVAGLTAQLKGDQASIDNARTQLAYTSVTSPIDGLTGIRHVDIGNNVRAADTTGIVVVTQVQPITVIFTLPEESLGIINQALKDGPVQVRAMSRDEKTEFDRGTVQLVDNQIDETTGTIRIKAVFDNKQNRLWPGQFVNAHVLVRTDRNALTIPSTALQRGPDGMFTYVVKSDSTVEVRLLKVEEETGSVVVVASGVKEGEPVVTTNQYRLEPGAQVHVSHPGESSRKPGESRKSDAGSSTT